MFHCILLQNAERVRYGAGFHIKVKKFFNVGNTLEERVNIELIILRHFVFQIVF